MRSEVEKEFIKKWGNDDRISLFLKNYDTYIDSLSLKMKEIIIDLLHNFDYYSHKEINKNLKNLHNKIIDLKNVDIDYTIFCVLKSQNCRYNSSYEYFTEYKQLNNLNKHSIIPELSDAIKKKDQWLNIENIVFIDDFCGSGKTFMNFIKNYIDELSEKRIIYVVVHIMKNSYDDIMKFAEEKKLTIIVIYKNCRRKAFEVVEYSDKQKKCFGDESKKMLLKDDYIFGYNETEALAAFYNNTPNNTLGVFWMSTNKNNPLFIRKNEKIPGWMQLKKAKKQRKSNNYVTEELNNE